MRRSTLYRFAEKSSQFVLGLYVIAEHLLKTHQAERRAILLSWPATADEAAEHFLLLLDEIAERPDEELERHAARIYAAHLVDHAALSGLVTADVRSGLIAHAGVFSTAGGSA